MVISYPLVAASGANSRGLWLTVERRFRIKAISMGEARDGVM